MEKASTRDVVKEEEEEESQQLKCDSLCGPVTLSLISDGEEECSDTETDPSKSLNTNPVEIVDIFNAEACGPQAYRGTVNSTANNICPAPNCHVYLRSRKILLQHLAELHPAYKWQCDKCPLVLATKSGILRHKRSFHPTLLELATFEKCTFPDCNYSAPSQYKLAEHAQTHSTVAKDMSELTCSFCGVIAKTGGSFTRHMRSQHQTVASTKQLLRCKWYYIAASQGWPTPKEDNCLYSTLRQDYLTAHYKNTHKNFPCRLCHAILPSRAAYKKHYLDVHPTKCLDILGKTPVHNLAERKSSLRRHTRTSRLSDN